ncbi:MAG: sulfatase-like hydrolase/transferase [Planctomycetota bacterium]
MATDRPNILLLITDQQRHDTVAALGNPLIKTPALDRMCREGTAFTRAYTPSPVCVPARHAMASGLPPHVSGVFDLWDASRPTLSFMQRLNDAGYQTHGVGKMHFTPDAYAAWGFQSRDTSEEGSRDPDRDDYARFLDEHGYEHVRDPYGYRSEFYYVPQPSQLPERLHHTRWCADRSIDFLQRRDASRPFLLCTHFVCPHPPFASPYPWSRLYRADEPDPPFVPEDNAELLTYWNHAQNRYKWRDGGTDRHVLGAMRAAYYASISYIDHQVGRMLDALGNAESNTLVIFSSDHGELLGDYGSFGKRCMLDAAARVPLLVRWPGRVEADQCCSTPASLLDIHTTATTAAGLGPDAPHPEGVDLVALARGDADRYAVFSTFQRGGFGLHMAATADTKYIHSEADGKDWFFDQSDGQPEHTSNPDDPRCAELRERLLQRYRDDGYTEPLNDAQTGWRDWPRREVPQDPTVGLLYQDPPELQADIDRLGPYARDVTKPPEEAQLLLRPHG